MKQSLKDVCNHLEVWKDWKNNYNHFVPLFIVEAATGKDWSKWDQSVFNEFFHRSSGQCVSSLRQGYFTRSEQEKIKNNWQELAPLLQKIAISQNDLCLNDYWEIKKILRKYTKLDRRAATNRLIASLQPQLLCTVVNESKIGTLFTLLSTHVSNFDLEWKDNWFENSHQILQFFKRELNQNNGFEILTLPWQVFEEYDPSISIKSNDMSEIETNLDEYLNILEYKKQIILQGPPGTGKTRMAKELAEKLTSFNLLEGLTKDFIVANCINQMDIPAAKTKLVYKILGVNDSGVRVENSEGKEYTAPFNEIIRMYESTAWEKEGMIINGTHSYSAAVAKFLHNKGSATSSSEDIGFCKIIQFHPSYTYEDFVRGIVAKPHPDGDGIIYEAENKTLAQFAEEALKNYMGSQPTRDYIKINDDQVKSDLDLFITHVIESIDKDEKYAISENVYIFYVDDKRFKYKGDNWEGHAKGLNMNFSELKKIIEKGISERSDIVKEQTLNALTRSHATYYANIIEKYKDFIAIKSSQVKATFQTPKNYVLIIDEINRANLSSVLGELIYALEYRGEAVDSMYEVGDSNKLTLPPNLYIIGTMNTADRSVGHIDYAIRRRFAFVDVLPKELQDDEEIYFNNQAFSDVSALFNDQNVSKEFEIDAVQIGHSYFIVKKKDAENEARRDELFNLKMQYEIKPILLEYERDGILIGEYKGQPIKDYIKSL